MTTDTKAQIVRKLIGFAAGAAVAAGIVTAEDAQHLEPLLITGAGVVLEIVNWIWFRKSVQAS